MPAFLAAFDAHERYRSLIARRVYLARYLRLPPSEVEAMPISLIADYIDALSELIARENAKRPTAAGVASAAETEYL